MDLYQQLKKITTFCLDVDGVLTNSDLLIANDGKLWRTMNARDGLAMRWAIEHKYNVAIITGGRNDSVAERLKALGVKDVFLASYNKVNVLEKYMADKNLNKDELLFMGDDVIDLGVMKAVGFSACPYDADREVKKIANYISPKKGGQGCVRDIIEKTLCLNGHWQF